MNGNKIYESGPRPGYYKLFTYDAADRLIGETEIWPDGTELSSTHRYDVLSHKIATVDVYGNEMRYTYDTFGRPITTELPPLYDSKGMLLETHVKIDYDHMGNAIARYDASGLCKKVSYTTRGTPTRIEYPDGSLEKKEYSLDGLLVLEVAKNGTSNRFYHDALGRMIRKETTDSAGNLLSTTSSTYNSFHLLSETDEEGLATYYDYDGAGRKIAMRKGERLTQYEYDALGRVISITEKIGNGAACTTLKAYDLLDRVIEEIVVDVDQTILKREMYEYDVDGNQTEIILFGQAGISKISKEYTPHKELCRVTDALGNTTHIKYDYGYIYQGQGGLKITKIDPKGNQEIKIHDTNGNLACQLSLNPFGMETQKEIHFYNSTGKKVESQHYVYNSIQRRDPVITQWIYDRVGNLTTIVEAKGTKEEKRTSYRYNKFGQKIQTKLANGISIYHEYDAFGRLATYRSSDETIHYTYQYDKKGNPLCVSDVINGNSTKCRYDMYGQLLDETLANGLTLSYEYDLLGRVKTVQLPDNTSFVYHYDACHLKQIDRIKSNKVPYTHTYDQFDLSGNVLSETLIGHAGRIEYQYDLLKRTIATVHPHWQEVIPPYGYDEVGNVLSRKVTDDLGHLDYTYTYDDLYQITSEAGAFSHTYQNDSLQNRVAKDEQPYQINSLNQLLEQADTSYEYDRNGNLISKRQGSLLISYQYDALDRLIAVNNGITKTRYIYDSSHRRVSKITDNIKEDYIFQAKNEIGTVQNGKIVQLRMLGLTRGAEVGATVAIELDGAVYAPIHDPYGNIVVLLDTEGNIAETYRYSAFGETISMCSIDNPWRFSSKRYDPETGFLYFGYRYYDPVIGRWITPDPAGFADGPNLYAYTHNRPLVYIDPDGRLVWFLAPMVFSMALEACLPAAVAIAEPYVGVSVTSLLVGFVKGSNGDVAEAFSCGGDAVAGGIGFALGMATNIRGAITKGVSKAGTAAASYFFEKAAREATGVVAENLAKKGAKQLSYNVWKGSNQASIATQFQKSIYSTERQVATQSISAPALQYKPYTKSNLQLGREMHREYKLNAAGLKEFRLPSGKRIDFLDPINNTIYELKPNNPRAIRLGEKQLKMYLEEVKNLPEFKNNDWKTILETY